MRFAVSNRIEADARLAQAEAGRPRAEAFVEPRELEAEQRALYRAAVRGYLDAFADTDARAVELPFRAPLDDLGVELVSNPGIAAELPDGGRELRKVVVGAARPANLLDSLEVKVAVVRTEEWAPDELRIVAVDVVALRRVEHVPDLAADRAAARAWLAPRVERVLELAEDARPRPGRDCLGCSFVAGCSAHAG